jgi:hypothetical protein
MKSCRPVRDKKEQERREKRESEEEELKFIIYTLVRDGLLSEIKSPIRVAEN